MREFVLRPGDKGQEVRRAQIQLSLRGYGKLEADGVFGPATAKAVSTAWDAVIAAQPGVVAPKPRTDITPALARFLNTEVLFGIDVSAYQSVADYKKAYAAGYRVCVVKLSEGRDGMQSRVIDRVKAVREAGFKTGFYHFARPDTNAGPGDARAEADFFLEVAHKCGGIQPGDIIPTLDMEAGKKEDDQYNAEWGLEWLDLVHADFPKSVPFMIYSAKWYWDAFLKNASPEVRARILAHPLWLSCYSGTIEPARVIEGWPWEVWQDSGSAEVPGIKGHCDTNIIAGGALNRIVIR